MQELLLSAGIRKGQFRFPDSGPGSKTLISGTKDLGYFGTVAGDQLITRAQFLLDFAPTAGTEYIVPTGETFIWHKVIYKEKILYIPSHQMKSSLSWNDIYAVGEVYGTKGNGLFPAATPVDQYKTFYEQDQADDRWYGFIVRMPHGSRLDPYTSLTDLTDNEWTDLSRATELSALQSLNTTAMSMNTASANNAQYGYRTKTTMVSGAKSTASAGIAWVPFIELIPMGSETFGPDRLYSVFDGDNPPSNLTFEFTDVVLGPTGVHATQYDQRPPQQITYELT